MAPRGLHLLISSSPQIEEIAWLKKLGKLYPRPFSMRQMLAIEQTINRLELPCRIETISEVMSLHIYSRNAEVNSLHERPIPLLSIRDSQVPRGDQPFPRLGTLGKAWLSRLAFDSKNKTRCATAGISPGSIRPGALYPYR